LTIEKLNTVFQFSRVSYSCLVASVSNG